MTFIFSHEARQRAKFRREANRAGVALKAQSVPEQPIIKIGFAFDDGVVTVQIDRNVIMRSTAEELGQYLFDAVIAAVTPDTGKPN